MQQTHHATAVHPIVGCATLATTVDEHGGDGRETTRSASPPARRSDQPGEIDIRELAARVTGSARFDDGAGPGDYAARLRRRLAGMMPHR